MSMACLPWKMLSGTHPFFFSKRSATHAEDSEPRQLVLSFLPPAVEQIHGSHHEGGVQHIYTAVHTCTVHLEGGEREDGCDEAGLGVLALGIEQRNRRWSSIPAIRQTAGVKCTHSHGR